MKKSHKPETLLSQHAENRADHQGAVVPPIYQNSLFTFPNWDAIDQAFDDRANHYIYSRGKNPNVQMVEAKIAAIAGGEKAQLFPSGMAAITACCLHCLGPGDHVIAIKNLYGPAINLLSKYLAKKMGIDLEVHSCSKYLGGHSDIIGGVVIGKAEDIDEIFLNEYELLGAKTAPMEAWLLMRSLRTLPMRMERHQKNAMVIANFLSNHPAVRQVSYTDLPDFPQYELAQRQMSGFSGLMDASAVFIPFSMEIYGEGRILGNQANSTSHHLWNMQPSLQTDSGKSS